MKHLTFYFYLILVVPTISLWGQKKNSSDSSVIKALNQQIDNLVIKQDTTSLLHLYGDDFVFNHGSGKVEGRSSWFRSVAKGDYTKRQHDSVRVEMHNGLIIVRGKLNVSKKNNNRMDHYYLWYLRVYAYRKRQWQMISHTTYYELHLPSTEQ